MADGGDDDDQLLSSVKSSELENLFGQAKQLHPTTTTTTTRGARGVRGAAKNKGQLSSLERMIIHHELNET